MYIIKNGNKTLCRSESGFTLKVCLDGCSDIMFFKHKCSAQEIAELMADWQIIQVCRVEYCGLYLCYDGRFSLYVENGGWFTPESLKHKTFLPSGVVLVWE